MISQPTQKSKVSNNLYTAYEAAIMRLLSSGGLCHSVAEQSIEVYDVNYTMRLIAVGEAPPDAPTLVIIAGVHGIESIGVDILLNYLSALTVQSGWSDSVRSLLQRVRLLAIPMANPSGIAIRRRANANGVDLMRNAPVDARVKATWMVGGHRYSRCLPWFRGRPGVLEQETQVLFDWCNSLFCRGPCTLVLDIHSGFGLRDQIWYPYAGQKTAFPRIGDVLALERLFDASYPHHHHYQFSQQSQYYITHGDLWDWIYDHRFTHANQPFLPLTLELGSWLWLKKNPKQLLNKLGLFHPMVEHRRSRVLRQHFSLLDFLIKAVEVWPTWIEPGTHA